MRPDLCLSRARGTILGAGLYPGKGQKEMGTSGRAHCKPSWQLATDHLCMHALQLKARKASTLQGSSLSTNGYAKARMTAKPYDDDSYSARNTGVRCGVGLRSKTYSRVAAADHKVVAQSALGFRCCYELMHVGSYDDLPQST